MLAGDLAHAGDEPRLQPALGEASLEARLARPGKVGEQIQRRQLAGEALEQRLAMRLQPSLRQPLLLPQHDIAKAKLERGQRGRPPRLLGGVELEQLGEEVRHRLGIRDQVVKHQRQHVAALRLLEEGGAHQRRLRQRDGQRGERGDALVERGRPPRLGQRREIDDRAAQLHRLVDHHRQLALDRGDPAAQHLVPPHQLAHHPDEPPQIEGALEAERHRHVVRRGARIRLLVKPDLLLRQRERTVRPRRTALKPGAGGGQIGALDLRRARPLLEAQVHALVLDEDRHRPTPAP